MKSISTHINESLKPKSNYNFKIPTIHSKNIEILDTYPVKVQNIQVNVAVVKFDNKLHLCDFKTGNILTSENVKNTKKFVNTYFKDEVNKITLFAYLMVDQKPLNIYYDYFFSIEIPDKETVILANGNEVYIDYRFECLGVEFGAFKQGKEYVVYTMGSKQILGVR